MVGPLCATGETATEPTSRAALGMADASPVVGPFPAVLACCSLGSWLSELSDSLPQMQPQQVRDRRSSSPPILRAPPGCHPPAARFQACQGRKEWAAGGLLCRARFLAERVPSSPDGTLSETAMVRLLSQRVKMAVMVFHSELWRYPMCGCREWSLDHILGGCATD